MKIDTQLFKGSMESPNKNLTVSYIYNFEQDGKYVTLKETLKGNISIHHSFGISISEGFDKPQIFIPGIKYYHFLTLFDKSVTLISENLYEIFPNINKLEFEADARVLERFQTEKALSTTGMTAIPAVWVDETSLCYPAIRINTKNGSVTIPMEDAIPIREMFKHFDPVGYAINMLRFFGRWE